MRMMPDIIASLMLHVLGAALLYIFEGYQPESKPLKVTYITAVQPAAKQKSKMPNRAATVESSKGSKVPETKAPPKENRNAKQMTVKEPIKKVEKKPSAKKEKAKKKSEPAQKKPDKIHTPKKGTENGDKRAAILRELERKKRLSALKGAKERNETSKDGVEGDVPSSSLGPVDAILGAYIEKCRQSILQNWSVLPTIVQKNPDLSVLLEVRVSASGSISKIKVYKSSGNASFDRSAVMALNKTAKLPSPPNKYQKSAAGGILIQLDAKDKTL